MLKPGDVAPDFNTTDHSGRPLRLRDLRGRKVVLWFFPKADTGG
jgi:thioredoxin-dependent peroxiredoxin